MLDRRGAISAVAVVMMSILDCVGVTDLKISLLSSHVALWYIVAVIALFIAVKMRVELWSTAKYGKFLFVYH
jgi:hypothetical protein